MREREREDGGKGAAAIYSRKPFAPLRELLEGKNYVRHQRNAKANI